MKPWTAWLARLGLAGSCLLWAGCGGGGSKEAAPESGASPEAVPGASADATPPAAQNDEAAAAPAAAGAPAAAAAPAPAAPAGDNVAIKGEAGSTAEMLAMANGPAPSAEGEKPAEAASPSPGMPGMPGMMPSMPGMPGMPSMPSPPGMASMPGPPGGNMAANYPKAPGMPGMPGMGPAAMPGMMGGPGMAGMMGAGGMGGDANAPADFRTPQSAAATFITALRAKDPDRLREATAQRAATESIGPYQKAFAAILESSLAAEDFDALAKQFEGMQITSMNPPKSTGRAEVIVGKAGKQGAFFTRKITVRKEKAGWKVVDIAGQREFEKPINIMGPSGTRVPAKRH